MTYFAFNHLKGRDLILSTTWVTELWLSLNSLLFLSFQISHTVANQMTYVIERRLLPIPPLTLNWVKWADTWEGTTAEIPSHLYIRCQTEPKVLQCKNKCWEDSTKSHLAAHNLESWSRTPRRCRFSFVGNLSRSNRQANKTTFRGTSLCQRSATGTGLTKGG